MSSSQLPRRGTDRLPSLATRLLIPLLVVVGGVMAAFAAWALVQRERTMVADARRETQTYGIALGLAFEAAFRDPDRSSVPEIVDRISRQPSVYGVVVYDEEGRPLFGPGSGNGGEDSTPPEPVLRVLRSGETTEFERVQDDVDVFSVVRPITDELGVVVGAFEILQPLSAVELEAARTRLRFVLNTLVLLVAVTTMILWLVNRFVSEPLTRFAEGVRELGSGRLQHRVESTVMIRELASVADELNRMAAGLETAQAEIVRGAEERIGLERQIRQSEKMAMVGQLAAGLAHEIGAPLHVIRGRADLLLASPSRPTNESRQLSIIVEQIDRITRIVRNLLDFARHGEAQVTPVDLVTVIDGVVELVSIELDRTGIEVERSGLGSAVVLGDRDGLQQVVLNLILNACQALADVEGERKIRIRTSIVATEDGDEVVVEFTDSGPGVPAEYHDRIFEPFFTTKSGKAGTGLGLAVARWILEDHHGRLTLAMSDAPGAVLTIRIPAYDGAADGD